MVEQRNRVDRSGEEEGGEKGAATATTLKHLCFSVCIYSSWATSGRIGQKKKNQKPLLTIRIEIENTDNYNPAHLSPLSPLRKPACFDI